LAAAVRNWLLAGQFFKVQLKAGARQQWQQGVLSI